MPPAHCCSAASSLAPTSNACSPGASPQEFSGSPRGHFAERFQLFIILALGEQVVLSGGTAADAGLDVLRVLALTTAFAVTAALWWLYFDEVASNSKKVIAEHEDPGRLARDAFTYLHFPIVAGIIAAAVGAEIIILHPDEHEHGWPLVVLIAGPPLYLFGEAAFRWRMARKFSAARLSVTAALLCLAVPAGALPALAVGAIQALLIGGLAAYELRARPRRLPAGLLDRTPSSAAAVPVGIAPQRPVTAPPSSSLPR